MDVMYEIKRGDIYWVKPIGDFMGGKTRPVVVVSNDKANEHSKNVTVIYLTSCEDVRYMPTHCKVKAMEESVALCEKVTTISKERLEGFIRVATDEEMDAVNRCLMIALGLSAVSVSVIQEPEDDSEWDAVISPVDILEEILESCNEIYLTETNDDVAEGIDCVARMIRGKLRKELTRG